MWFRGRGRLSHSGMHLHVGRLSERLERQPGPGGQARGGPAGSGGASRGAGAERRQTPKTGGGAWHPETHIRRCCQEQCNRRYGRKQKFPELKADQVCISKEGRSYRGGGNLQKGHNNLDMSPGQALTLRKRTTINSQGTSVLITGKIQPGLRLHLCSIREKTVSNSEGSGSLQPRALHTGPSCCPERSSRKAQQVQDSEK